MQPPSNLIFHNNGGTFPPHGAITPKDHGAYVVVTTWILMCLTVLSLIARLGTRRNSSKDYIAITAASTISIVQSVLVHIAVNHGLGRHRGSVRRTNFVIYSKAKYVGQMLEVAVLCLAKISLLIVFMHLTPSRPAGRALRTFTSFVVFWGIAAIFALAFVCERPNPWDLTPARCYNQDIVYFTNGAIDILTDLIIILLPCYILWDVKIAIHKKVAIFSIFAIRILVCVCSAIRLSALTVYLGQPDQTWFDVGPTIWTQITTNMSIITACIPLMKPFLENLQFSLVDSSVFGKPSLFFSRLQSKDQSDRSGRTAGS